MKKKRAMHRALSLSLSDSGIANCNMIFWEKCKESEAHRLWALGQKLGVTHQGEAASMIEKFLEMEKRDAADLENRSSQDRGHNEVNQ